MNTDKSFFRKVAISGILRFETAFHIGSGREGELAADMGILREPDGRPILPGSSLKGNFRAFAERLSGYLGFTACLLGAGAPDVKCVGDENYRKSVYDEFKKLKREHEKLAWIEDKTCGICKLFGSPLQASRIFFSDGRLIRGGHSVEIRDGVCIDRDTETARPGAKYDFEVVPAGAEFQVSIDLENPENEELGLIAAVLAEWENGFRLGGFTSRGLGKVLLTNTTVRQINYNDPAQLKAYLLKRRMSDAPTLLDECLNLVLSQQGEKDA